MSKLVFEVCTESVEARTHCHEDWTRERLIDEFSRRTDSFPCTLKTFKTYAEARAFFDEEARTLNAPHEFTVSVGRMIAFEVLFIDEVEVDDDGVEQSRMTTDITATPLEHGED